MTGEFEFRSGIRLPAHLDPQAADAAPGAIDLHLTVRDPEVAAELGALPEGRERLEFALGALRIGVLALKQAQGRLDADAMRSEGDRLLAQLGSQLVEHQTLVTQQVSTSLKEYFDPESGRFNERVKRLVQKDGELEAMLRRQIGAEDSELAKTLASHFGEQSPIMKLLSPEESSGVIRSLTDSVEEVLGAQSEGILAEFSLDNGESALNKLITELDKRHGMLSEGFNESVDKVVSEFSLDREDSALSKLVGQVERSQRLIAAEFTLDEESSALARMRRELLDVLKTHKDADLAFREAVLTELRTMSARKEESRRSTTHGVDFEAEVGRFLMADCQRAGDVAAATGNRTGRIKNSKVGDFVIELGPESVAAGARIVVEAKEKSGYDLRDARAEIDTGRKNRDAAIGLFVFSKRSAPETLAPFARYGDDVFVVWDAEDMASDVFFEAGLSVARALSTRAAVARESQAADFEAIDRAILSIEKQSGGLDEITTLTGTIKNNADKILKRAAIMRNAIAKQIALVNEGIDDLRAADA